MLKKLIISTMFITFAYTQAAPIWHTLAKAQLLIKTISMVTGKQAPTISGAARNLIYKIKIMPKKKTNLIPNSMTFEETRQHIENERRVWNQFCLSRYLLSEEQFPQFNKVTVRELVNKYNQEKIVLIRDPRLESPFKKNSGTLQLIVNDKIVKEILVSGPISKMGFVGVASALVLTMPLLRLSVFGIIGLMR